jgi:UDPglucose 6-dehydrogenase
MVTLTVIGTGYVGLVSGACLADFGNSVTCVDTDAAKIARLRQGIIPIFESGLDAVVERNTQAGRLTFTTVLADALATSTVVFIAVGTPPADDGSADLRHVEQVAREIGQHIEHYTVIVDKSTVPIGTGVQVKRWIGEELANRGKTVPFDVVSNPEFLREGTAVYDFTHPDRVVIGSESSQARNIMKEVYRALYLSETPYMKRRLQGLAREK